MKKTLSLLASAMLFASCLNESQPSPEMIAMQQSRDSLQAIVDAKDSEISVLFETLNQIEDNLSIISSKYGAVQEMKRNNPEATASRTSQIASQLDNIDKMLADNKKKIAYLNEKLKAFGEQKGTLQEFVSKLEDRIATQEQQIAELNEELANSKVVIEQLNQNVSDLTAENQQKDQTIAQHVAEANRAYYIIGTYDQLHEAGVVGKSGGFIGIGRKQSANANMPTHLFTEIDKSKASTIPVDMKNAVLISSHPEGSYELVADQNDKKVVSYLEILDPVLFWQNTRYLIISTK